MIYTWRFCLNLVGALFFPNSSYSLTWDYILGLEQNTLLLPTLSPWYDCVVQKACNILFLQNCNMKPQEIRRFIISTGNQGPRICENLTDATFNMTDKFPDPDRVLISFSVMNAVIWSLMQRHQIARLFSVYYVGDFGKASHWNQSHLTLCPLHNCDPIQTWNHIWPAVRPVFVLALSMFWNRWYLLNTDVPISDAIPDHSC